MKTLSTVAIALMAFAVATLASTGGWSVELAEGSTLWLEGDSTLHAFESEATVLNLKSTVEMPTGKSESNARILADGKQEPRITALTMKVPIEHMKSGVIGLASRLHKTLKYKEHPNIVFTMIDYEVEQNSEQQDLYNVTASGTLQMAGEENEVTLNMTASHSNEYVDVEGEKKVLMTDFGVEPPSLMFGAIKTDDEIVVHWDLKLKLQKTNEGRPMDAETKLSKK
jgi:hypothetical protein